ncbi:Nif11-like leader peptide family natural product precursor [Amphritea sp.]|uniref:Nif11-like leader peptide family natural product precursor n=1 Tax=Amphritea sp. TaxID=1872502 RepID=UPI003D131E2F
MSVEQIAGFSAKAKADAQLAEQLKACIKMKEMFSLARENGFEFDEDSLYPPNEPQFTEDQLSERLAKALLRV